MKLTQIKKQNFITRWFKKHWLLVLAFVYFLSPIDFIPDALPGLGFGDDVGVVLLSLVIEALKKRLSIKKATKNSKKNSEKVIEAEIIE